MFKRDRTIEQKRGSFNPRAKSVALISGTLAVAVALFAYGFAVSCSVDDTGNQDFDAAYGEDSRESVDYSANFYGEDNWSFMSKESLASFEVAFYPWLLRNGLEDGAYVYLHSEDISCEDGIWSAYARTPVDDAYYKVGFDAATKEMSFEEVVRPAFAESVESERTEIQGTGGEDPSVSPQDSDTPSDRRDVSSNIPLDDASALSSRLPTRAAESLPRIIVEYSSGKGIETAPALCSIYPESIARNGQDASFEILVYDPQKIAYIVTADYDGTQDRFGFSIRQM